MIYLYYNVDEWKEDVIKQTEKYSSQKDSSENKAVVSALYALFNKDFNQFSVELSRVCKGRKKSKQFGENQFSKSVSFFSLGLYNFAKYLYPVEVNQITLPTDDNFLMDYLLYQQDVSTLDDGYILQFNEKLHVLKTAFKVDAPNISLMKNGRTCEVDYLTYKLVKRIMVLNN